MAIAYETSVPAAYRTAFIAKVITICNRLGIDPNWLMIVMRFESANTFSPSVKNPNSEAYGLIQFTAVGISGLGVTLDQLKAMDAVTQLDWVEKYLNPYRGRMTDLYQVYLAVFAPAYIGRPDAQKVYVSPSKQYTANKPLDTNNDGVITVGEIKQVISRYIPAGYSAGSTTTDQKVLPIAAIAVIIVLFLPLNAPKSMAKTFTPITQAGPIQAPVTAKTTLINSSSANLFVTSDELDDAMSELSASDKNAVLNALYAVKPGGSLALSAGTYNLSFANRFAQSAVLLVDIKA